VIRKENSSVPSSYLRQLYLRYLIQTGLIFCTPIQKILFQLTFLLVVGVIIWQSEVTIVALWELLHHSTSVGQSNRSPSPSQK